MAEKRRAFSWPGVWENALANIFIWAAGSLVLSVFGWLLARARERPGIASVLSVVAVTSLVLVAGSGLTTFYRARSPLASKRHDRHKPAAIDFREISIAEAERQARLASVQPSPFVSLVEQMAGRPVPLVAKPALPAQSKMDEEIRAIIDELQPTPQYVVKRLVDGPRRLYLYSEERRVLVSELK